MKQWLRQLLFLLDDNEDCDPKVFDTLSATEPCGCESTKQNIESTIKWKLILTSRLAVRLNISRSELIRRVAEMEWIEALHYAARRGDMEIVELLLEHGAKPSIKNDLGRDVLS